MSILLKITFGALFVFFILVGFSIFTFVFGANLKPIDSKLLAKTPVSTGFDFPVGKVSSKGARDAKGYYNAQTFGKNYHLGEDWNGVGGGNTDMGDPIYSISDGVVVSIINHKLGWGRVLRIVHNIGSISNPRYIESLYAHLNEFKVKAGTIVKKGDLIGTIGNANGRYLAHLHLELRDQINLPLGAGYSKKTKGYLNPTEFIKRNRVILK